MFVLLVIGTGLHIMLMQQRTARLCSLVMTWCVLR